MADDGILEALRSLHRELTSVEQALKEDREERGPPLLAQVSQSPLLEILGDTFLALLDKPGRRKESRDAVLTGKVQFDEEEWTLNRDFQEIILQVADELDLDEIEAAKLSLLAEEEELVLGRPRRECAIIRFHQQRKYLLSCTQLLLELSKEEDELLADDTGDNLGYLSQYVAHNILRQNVPGVAAPAARPRFVPACMAAMRDIRAWLQKLAEQVTGATVLGRSTGVQFQETIEFTHISLMEQHELLAVILCHAIEKHVATREDFVELIRDFRKHSRYDFSIVHMIPVLGTYITIFGSTEGSASVEQARELNAFVCEQSDDHTRAAPFLDAALRAWWLAEYSGWYMEDAAGSGLPDIDIDKEDQQRSKQFTEALKDGAFDFMFAVLADVKTSEWQDPSRHRIRNWLQQRTPHLPVDTVPFSSPLQNLVTAKMETFVDAFISNMPDVLRRLKIEEDEQRQNLQGREQDLDLERFLLIIAYTCEGRPEAADAFWADPESNMAGFLQWTSKRTTTPLQLAFCEMLQGLSDDEESATSAHEFLLDEGHQLRRPSSITWARILKELDFFVRRIRDKPAVSQSNAHRTGKPGSDQAEMEDENGALQESYLRLMAKLATHSETARLYLLQQPQEKLVEMLFELISSQVPAQARGYAFKALSSLVCRKTLLQNYIMWQYLESCLTGLFMSAATSARASTTSAGAPPPSFYMEALFQEMSHNLDEVSAFILFLVTLVSLPAGYGPLNDVLPYPEDLGESTRMRPGIEPYIDFTLGHIFSIRVQEARDVAQLRILRFYCLDFALTCLSTFNEDLIVFANESNISVDAAIQAKDLETYVTLHPFSRVMEWMYDSRFIKSLHDTIHQDPTEIGKAAPDSPLILGVLRAVELLSKVIDLQATYIDLVRPIVKPQNKAQSRSPYIPVSNGSFASIEDGLMTSMTLISDLGGYCGLGHPDLTLASLKLLEKLSTSHKVISAWHAGIRDQTQRNKAIVALEEHGDAEAISGAFIAEFNIPLNFSREDESPEYQIKTCILDFLYSCLQASPDRPTIAHLLLGFRCTSSTLEIEPGSLFDRRTALFHTLLPVLLDIPPRNEEGLMQQWLISLKYKVLRIFKILWSTPLSAGLILDELRENDFLFHLLMQGLVSQHSDVWDGLEASGPDFLAAPAAQGYVDYLSIRAMALGYIAIELCSASQGQTPALKRRIFDALGGQINVDGAEPITVPSIFEFQDSLQQEALFVAPPPELPTLGDLDLRPCLEVKAEGNRIYNIDKVRQMIILKRRENGHSRQVVLQQDAAQADAEEETMLLYVVYLNRLTQVRSYNLKVLRAWTRLLMVMTDCNDFKGTNEVSFLLQTLQATLPGLEMYGSENAGAAFELAKLARVLIYKLDYATTTTTTDKQSRAVENLISDKLFQLLQICLNAIAKWVGNQDLRAIYYSICYRHLTGLVDHGQGVLAGGRKTAKTIQAFGDKLLNVVCDDAFGGDAGCQAAALIFLGTLVQLGKQDNDGYVVEALNKLNFIGIVVDSLRHVLQEWMEINQNGNPDQLFYLNAKLAFLLQLCQTREGAGHVLHANLLRVVEQSGLFTADPELQAEAGGDGGARALERHYALLAKMTRIIGAATISRGSHQARQGRRFLTEHRMLVMHVLKRSAGIGIGIGSGAGAGGSRMEPALAERIAELAEAFMVIVTATGFLEFESEKSTEDHRPAPAVFH
ncbi:nucleoporin Nup186/Nup192/Nup205 [Xylariaceae sp. FL0804]|nr:nucleoporin Nup186/Nup192/Nup205 [Xylariaceae sp. FL0804]